MKTEFCAPFVLCGIDCDGESREITCSTLQQARAIAAQCMRQDADGPPWQSFAIWGNHPQTENWEALEQGEQGQAVTLLRHILAIALTIVVLVASIVLFGYLDRFGNVME